MAEEEGGGRDGGILGLWVWLLGEDFGVRWWMGAMARWEGLPVPGHGRVCSDGIDVIIGELGSTAGDEAGRESPEEKSAEERFAEGQSAVVRSAGSSAGRRCSERGFSEWVSAGSGTACSTVDRLGRATAAVVEDLGWYSRAG